MYETKNFKVATDPKLVCSCCGQGGPSVALLILLETIRAHFNAGVSISSCSRCKEYNKSEGGGKNSEHLIDDTGTSDAADINVTGVTPTQVRKYLKELPYANLLGIGKYVDFTHVDVRGYGARW